MRYREKENSLSESTYLETRVDYYDPGNNYSYPVSYISEQVYIAMLDIVTPNWREKVSQGVILNNPLLQTTFLRSQVPVVFDVHVHDAVNPSRLAVYGTARVIPNSDTATSLDWSHWDQYVLNQYADERDIAISKSWSNVDISAAQALASLGELPETMHWMASLFKRMISIIRAFSQKRLLITASKFVRNGKSVIDAMAELWLEFRYAVRPLIYDMVQAVEAWNTILKKSDRYTARGFHKTGPTVSSETSNWNLHANYDAIISRVQTVSANYRAGVLFSIDNLVNEVRSVWGLDKPFETIWELIPFSFIIDWFFTVGDVISSWTSNPGLHPLTSWIVEEHKLKSVCSVDGFFITNPVSGATGFDSVVTQSSGTTTVEAVTKRRIPTPSRPILPTFKLNLNTAKIFDLVTIGRNLLSSIGRS